MIIGLTGGIGSGKTAASNAFAELDVPIVDTDVISRTILTIKPELLTQLAERFGNNILDEQGVLIREKLRETAFASDKNKADLDSIMHPAIRQQTLSELDKNKESDYCVVVVPLLIETNFKALVNRVLLVTAPIKRRLEWLQKRSDLDEQAALAIISKQTDDKERLLYADDVINNNGTLKDISHKVARLHEQYLKLAITLKPR